MARSDIPAPGTGWLLSRSLWLVAPVLSAGLLTGPVLLVLGWRARLGSLLSLGAVFSLAAGISMFMNPEAAPMLHTVIWVIGTLSCVLVNRQWLRNRWATATGGVAPGEAWHHGLPSGGVGSSAGCDASAGGGGAGASAATAADGGAARTATADGDAAVLLEDPALRRGAYFADAGEPALDVNTATERELTALPAIGRRRAARTVEHVRRNGPFASLQDYGRAIGLTSKDMEKLRGRIGFGPGGHDPDPRPGRKVDY